MKKIIKIAFTGGGTAGHIFPIVAIVREMKKIHPDKDLSLFYIGPKDEYSLAILAQEGVKVKKNINRETEKIFFFQEFLGFL